MFKSGQNKARKIMSSVVGKKKAKAMWDIIRWSYSSILPKEIDAEWPDIKWAGFCCPMTDGSQTIIINPEYHNDSDEIALTIGHELAHVLQNVMKGAGNANHDDEIFRAFRTVFCKALEFTEESF